MTRSCYLLLLLICNLSYAQTPKEKTPAEKEKPLWSEELFSSLKFRSIGPAFMSGRIADVAVHPNDANTWIVAVGSGGVWKTTNRGTTWTPVFDDQPSYSTGCVTYDVSNPNNVWVGTGENVGGRHVGFGDGVYKSIDGGNTFVNSGLKLSEHISKIVVHPTNSDIVWVAAQGPLWSKGGERGIFKTTDGGKTWKQTLGDKEWVGATDIVMDPRHPDVLYAATWQRNRTVAAYLGGGPGSGIHKSTDGGETWVKLSAGLPTSNMGKIGLAVSPQNPDVVYAAIELDRRTGGVYKSTNKGASWQKQSDAVSGATGPHYYQELYASPHQFDKIYLADVRVQISDDGGKNFRTMKEENKHSDNHAIVFHKDNPGWMLVGTDGGLYETFDNGDNWRFIDNLPLTQFYKVAVDDASPFYNVYGGTQDNSTEGGPSRTDNVQGIQNSDWRVVLDWDGHQPATEPGNPDIVYGERQEGTLSRIDMKTGEVVDIQPQPGEGEPYERFNWDSPILVSPHAPTTIFFASQRLWRSENRGDSWTALSGDLTRNEKNRLQLPIMGSTQSYDNAWDLLAMSNYNTITSVAESPKQKDLIYVGTDDGLIQITEDGGKAWRKIEITALPGVPASAFVNDIKADLFDASTAYVALDNHKAGDFTPYLFVTNDKGKIWKSLRNNLPDRTLVWRLVQDHVKKDLMFIGTEWGIYFSVNGGSSWTKLKGGLPTIPFRDLAIQRRENDLVGASFGRSFYILDDYSPLRSITEDTLKKEAKLFDIKDAWWYVPRSHLGFEGSKGDQGAGHFVAPNPPFGAVVTYYLKEDLKTAKEMRKEMEKKDAEAKKPLDFPNWSKIAAEESAPAPKVWVTIKDMGGRVIRRIEGPVKKGFHRVAWDLRHPTLDAIRSTNTANPTSGFMCAPGRYSATISKEVNGEVSTLSEPEYFEVKPMKTPAIKGADHKEVAKFWRDFDETIRKSSALTLTVNNTVKYCEGLKRAATAIQKDYTQIAINLTEQRSKLTTIEEALFGIPAKNQMGEKNNPNMGSRMFDVFRGVGQATHGPTDTNKKSLALVNKDFEKYNVQLAEIQNILAGIGKEIFNAGGPFVERLF
ncbi:MAG: glycosyl hydrolase [Saprospiraceae bacterium]|nr:glycosyl hydrolase [Saprospiraceae bacterium]